MLKTKPAGISPPVREKKRRASLAGKSTAEMTEFIFGIGLLHTAPILVRIDNSAHFREGMDLDFPIGKTLVTGFANGAMPHLAAYSSISLLV